MDTITGSLNTIPKTKIRLSSRFDRNKEPQPSFGPDANGVGLFPPGTAQPMPTIETAQRSVKPPDAERASALRGGVMIRLHTHHASRLWSGRRQDKSTGREAIKSFPHFGGLLRTLTQAATQDDPWADWWLMRVQDHIDDGRSKLKQLLDAVEAFMQNQLPDEVSYMNAMSSKPLEIEVRFDSPLAYQAAYLLADFDKLARHVQMARHYGLIAREQTEQLLNQGAKVIRSILSRVDDWKFTGATRDDVAANNPKAIAAREKMGDCPQEILAGEKRSRYAPPLRRITNGVETNGVEVAPVP